MWDIQFATEAGGVKLAKEAKDKGLTSEQKEEFANNFLRYSGLVRRRITTYIAENISDYEDAIDIARLVKKESVDLIPRFFPSELETGDILDLERKLETDLTHPSDAMRKQLLRAISTFDSETASKILR